MDENQKEIVRRLVLLDSKLNYLSGVAICLFGIAVGAIAYFFIYRWIGDPWAFILASVALTVSCKAAEKTFRKSDP